MATNRVKSSTGVAAFEKNFQEGVTLKEDECCAEVHETPDGYLMPLEFLQAIATGHPNNVSTADGGRMQLGGMLPGFGSTAHSPRLSVMVAFFVFVLLLLFIPSGLP